VYGDWLHAPDAPTILVLGHFDVQPAGDATAWTTPPFEPTIRDGRIFARGATDDKGNMLQPILAVEAFLKCGGVLPLNIKFLLEGEEEILSPDMPAFLRKHKERYACDLVVSADGWQWSETESDLRLGLRGVCSLEVTVNGPSRELHSGLHGGAVANPIGGLMKMLTSIHDANGRVQVPGFQDAVRELRASERAAIAAVPFDEEAYMHLLGVSELAGETGYTTRERIGARPTVEFNGISGGWQGPGVKTAIPSRASATITCRLVPDQHPQRIAELVKAHLEACVPKGLTATVEILPNSSHPYRVAVDNVAIRAAREVLLEMYGSEPYYTLSGGSIPILPLFQTELGASTVVFGFGLPDERMHGPDENLNIRNFKRGQEAYIRLIDHLGSQQFGGGRLNA
jgi:acetylornithine deacetylase/succinyl-diaminopimelate desuccinylase-like protein